MKAKTKNIIICLSNIFIILLVLTIVMSACSTSKQDNETDVSSTSENLNGEMLGTDDNGLVINTNFGDLYFSEEWREFLDINIIDDDNTVIVEFNAHIDDNEYLLFDVLIGDNSDYDYTEVGSLTDSSGTKRSVYVYINEISYDDNLSDEEQTRLYAMQEEINYLIDNLK